MPPSDRFRPIFHFAPHAGWINDPNGLVYFDGEYHLFFQHHPYSDTPGSMHWGHAVSHDLIAWAELPVALYPDHNGVIFSGSAIVDASNSAGFGADSMIAVFTSHDDSRRPIERQSIAASVDRGRTFAKYAGNPVLAPLPGVVDFRDPRVFRFDDNKRGHWVLVLAAGDEVQFYRSDDLKTWAQTGAFGRGHGTHAGVWECPDLFPLPVKGTDEVRWVLVVGISHGAPVKGSGTQYFVGRFDGDTFVNENPPETILWLDWGADAYATQSWENAPDGRRIITSWMNNWHYARETPTVGWRGSMTLPRELSLRRTSQGIRAFQTPVAEIERHHKVALSVDDLPLYSQEIAELDAAALRAFDLAVDLAPGPNVNRMRVILRDGGQSVLTVGWDAGLQQVWVDRSAAGIVDFNPAFTARHSAPLSFDNNRLHLRLIVDANSIELFAGNGAVAISDLVYPEEGMWKISLLVEGDYASATARLREVVGGLE